MSFHTIKVRSVIAVSLLCIMASGTTFGEESPERAHTSDHRYKQRQTDRDDQNGYARHDGQGHHQGTEQPAYFSEQHRMFVHDYYVERYHAGRCPPGLSKRHQNCIPPGLDRRWRIGYPLPRDVIFYDVPPQISIQLGAPPPHHRYVRVAADILLIAIGTGIVVDAINDLDR